MRRYTAPGTYNCTWQVMNIASLDSGLKRERESFVLFTSLLVDTLSTLLVHNAYKCKHFNLITFTIDVILW